MIVVCIKRGNDWHGMIMKFQRVIGFDVFPLYA